MSTVAAIPQSTRVHSGGGRPETKSLLRQPQPQRAVPHPGQRTLTGYHHSEQQQQQQKSQSKHYQQEGRERILKSTSTSSDDYEEIDSDEDEAGSYHSEGDDIAQYWDPYCKSPLSQYSLGLLWHSYLFPLSCFFSLQCTSCSNRHLHQRKLCVKNM